MRDRSTLVILLALCGALALYLLVRSQRTSPQQPPVRSQPQGRTPDVRTSVTPRKRAAALQPVARPSSLNFQQQFQALRRRILDPSDGLIVRRKLLAATTVQQVLGLSQPLSAVFLQGIPRTTKYDAIQFVLQKNPTASQYILGLQVWLGKPGALQARWHNQRQTYPNVRLHARAVVGQQSFVGVRGAMYYLNVKTKTAVFSLSCDRKFCPQGKHLEALARTVASHLP